MQSIGIIGGGIFGLFLAAALKDKFRVHIFEKTDYKKFISGEHVPFQLKYFFKKLNIPLDILTHNSFECLGLSGSWAGNNIDKEGIFNAGYDYVLNRPIFDLKLCKWLIEEGVNISCNIAINNIQENSIFQNSKNLASFDLIIDCSGRTSNKFNNKRLVFDKLIGISAYQKKQQPAKTTKVVIESSKNGWWYQTSNLDYQITTYFTDSDLFRKEDFHTAYETTELYQNNSIPPDTKVFIKPSFTSILRDIPSKVYQLGDAFMSYDPLSSQGIFKAVKNAIEFSISLEQNAFESYYATRRKDFLSYLNIRSQFYSRGFEYHQSEFYKRRVSA